MKNKSIYVWQSELSSDIFAKSILFLISPLLGFMMAIRRINTKSSFIVLFLFAVFFGLNFETTVGRDETNNSDASVYRWRFEILKDMSQGDVSDVFSAFMSFDDAQNRDVYVPLVAFLATRISNNYHVFFAILAMVFAFFSLRTLRFFTSELEGRINLYVLILLYLFAITNSIFNINGCRFWTAAWVAVYSLFQIYRNGNKRYYFLAAITPMIHASYWFFLSVLLIALFLQKATRFWKIFFFASFILSSVSMQLVVDLSSYLPSSLQFLVERYTGEVELKTNLYQVIRRIFSFASTVLTVYMMYLLMKHEKEIKNNPKTNNLYPFLLVWMSICYFVMPIPSLGGRYVVLGFPILAYVWLMTFEKHGKYRNVLLLYPVANLMFIYELVCCYLEYSVPMSFYYTSPIYQFYKYIIIGVI